MPKKQNPFSWARKISSDLYAHDAIPLFGKAPPLDWEEFSKELASRFECAGLKIKADKQSWIDSSEIKNGMGDQPIVLALNITPFESPVFWIMSTEDMGKITSQLLSGQSKGRPLSSEILQEGFYRFAALEVLDVLQGMSPFEDFTFQLCDLAKMPENGAFGIDMKVQLGTRSSWGRLVIPPEFRASWAQHFASVESTHLPPRIAKSTELIMGVKVGSILFHQDEWKEIKKGDFIPLDPGGYDPRKNTGAATLVIGRTPLFQVKIKHNKIQLVDYAFYYEDESDMEKNIPAEESAEQAPMEGEGSAQAIMPAEEGEAVALKELPLYLTVELARLRVTLDQLVNLSPGNFLELPIHPDHGVTLTVNGQKVGHAELVHLGETLGIRIVELG